MYVPGISERLEKTTIYDRTKFQIAPTSGNI